MIEDLTEILDGFLWMGGCDLPCYSYDDRFTAIVDTRQLSEIGPPAPRLPSGRMVLHVPLVDDGATVPPLWKIRQAVNFIYYMPPGEKVLCNCLHGRNRSGLIVACYLNRAYKMTPNAAIRFVREKRPGAINNPVFEQTVRAWNDVLKATTPHAPLTWNGVQYWGRGGDDVWPAGGYD